MLRHEEKQAAEQTIRTQSTAKIWRDNTSITMMLAKFTLEHFGQIFQT